MYGRLMPAVEHCRTAKESVTVCEQAFLSPIFKQASLDLIVIVRKTVQHTEHSCDLFFVCFDQTSPADQMIV